MRNSQNNTIIIHSFCTICKYHLTDYCKNSVIFYVISRLVSDFGSLFREVLLPKATNSTFQCGNFTIRQFPDLSPGKITQFQRTFLTALQI